MKKMNMYIIQEKRIFYALFQNCRRSELDIFGLGWKCWGHEARQIGL